jgi:hypothetical protein
LASTAALAERNYDISSPPFGETILMTKKVSTSYDVQPFAAKVFVKGGVKDDAANDNSGKR